MPPANDKLKFFSILLLGINGILGSGIFLLPGEVSTTAQADTFMVYGAVTIMVLLISWCYARCSSYFTVNGGAYIYAKEAFGDFFGFQVGVMRWIVGVVAWSTMSVAFLTALSSVWPSILLEPYRSIYLITLIASLSLINIKGISWIKTLNNVATISKVTPIIIFIFGGIIYLFTAQDAAVMQKTYVQGSFGAGALLVFYAFSGFENLSVVAGEMNKPRRNLPIAIMASVVTCSFICIAIQYLCSSLLGDNIYHNKTPVADAAGEIFGPLGSEAIFTAMLLSIGGINVCASFVVPRSCEALSKDGILPKIISRKGQFNTPTYAILLSMLFAITIALLGDFSQLAKISVITRFLQYYVTSFAAMKFSCSLKFNPAIANGANLHQITGVTIPILATLSVTWLLLQANATQMVLGLATLAPGLIFYLYKYFHKDYQTY